MKEMEKTNKKTINLESEHYDDINFVCLTLQKTKKTKKSYLFSDSFAISNQNRYFIE